MREFKSRQKINNKTTLKILIKVKIKKGKLVKRSKMRVLKKGKRYLKNNYFKK